MLAFLSSSGTCKPISNGYQMEDEVLTGAVLGPGRSRVCATLSGTDCASSGTGDPGDLQPYNAATRYVGTEKPRSYSDDPGTFGAEGEVTSCGSDQDLTSFTVCAFVRMDTRNRRSSLLTYVSWANIVIEATRLGLALLVQEPDGQDLHSFFEAKMPPEVWRHFCLQFQYDTLQVNEHEFLY
nr:uncharacterized protein LOC123770380 [Procambarus clarkii]